MILKFVCKLRPEVCNMARHEASALAGWLPWVLKICMGSVLCTQRWPDRQCTNMNMRVEDEVKAYQLDTTLQYHSEFFIIALFTQHAYLNFSSPTVIIIGPGGLW